MKMSENATREYVLRMRVRYGVMKTKRKDREKDGDTEIVAGSSGKSIVAPE